MLILLMFLVLVALICLNVPIAVALAVSGMLGLLATEGLSQNVFEIVTKTLAAPRRG